MKPPLGNDGAEARPPGHGLAMKLALKLAACYLIASISYLLYLKWPDYQGHADIPLSGFPAFLVFAPVAPLFWFDEFAADPRNALVGLIVFGGVLAAGLWLSLRKRPAAERVREPYVSPYKVEFDDVEVRVLHEGTPHESVKWSDLTAVGIRIDDSLLSCPWWIMFVGTRAACTYPNDAVGCGEMLKALQVRLPGFNNIAVLEAMDLMEGGRLVWFKEPQEGVNSHAQLAD